ncbi:hypothetical protein K9N68_27815 [Kovacikia minuta CCNUW1]|uniref:hypothetical protein n=1 Tax=Kovacikia minuta TaxID=2931930 RepID=UPI001CCFE345|nr:hypothetical protein [Kovacikia minuta]UBF25372.1 hypothetical protein K9N68_27815 [Kovacikia minuta CCNUW1]
MGLAFGSDAFDSGKSLCPNAKLLRLELSVLFNSQSYSRFHLHSPHPTAYTLRPNSRVVAD